MCNAVALDGIEIYPSFELTLARSDRKFLLPDCAFTSSTWLRFRIDGNVIIQGNSTHPDPVERLLSASPLTELLITGTRFVNPQTTYVSDSYPYTVNWDSLFTKLPDISWILLDSTELAGNLPTTLPSSLTAFSAMNNRLSGSISPTIFDNMTTGSINFQVDNNTLSGNIPEDLFAPLSAMGVITVSFASNNLSGTIPADLFNATTASSWSVSFRGNQLSGNLPSTLFEGVKSLYPNIDLSSNLLTGPIPKNILAPLYQSSTFYLLLNVSRNRFNGTMPDWYAGFTSSSNLYDLDVDASRNQISDVIPASFAPPPLRDWNSYRLDLGYNALTGTVAPTIFFNGFYNLSSIASYIFLDHNLLTGTLPEQFLLNNDSQVTRIGLKVGANALTGTLPANLLAQGRPGGFVQLDFSHSALTGTIPDDLLLPCISSTTHDLIYNLSYNKFTGTMPRSIRVGVITGEVDLSHNSLTGSINSTAIFNSSAVTTDTMNFYFTASNNKFTGTLSIPDSGILNPDARRFVSIYAAYNQLTSLVFGNRVVELTDLDVSYNTKLTGTIRPSIFNDSASYLRSFRASHTLLSGPFPSFYDEVFSPVKEIDLSYTRVQFCKNVEGNSSFWDLSQLTSCDLSFTTAHSCPGKYPSICDTRTTSASEALKPISLFGFVIALLALAIVI